jgi:hypothetical protein
LGNRARRISIQAQPGKKLLRHYLKKNYKAKMTGDVAQMIEYSASKNEAPTSVPSTAKKKKSH